jgi:hypothetical protein
MESAMVCSLTSMRVEDTSILMEDRRWLSDYNTTRRLCQCNKYIVSNLLLFLLCQEQS